MIAIVGIKDVARIADVSIGTVSNVLKHPERVAPGTREKVMRVINETGFSINPFASALVTSQTNLIGFLVCYSNAGRRGSGVYEFTKAAAGKGYNVLLTVADMDFEKEKAAVETFIRYKVDGVVIYADYTEEGKSEHFRKLAACHIPCVVFKRYDSSYENITVTAQKAFQDLARQLKQYHHREVGVLTIDPYLSNGNVGIRVKRIGELRKVLTEAGISFPEDNILVVDDASVKAGKRAADEWLSRKDHLPTAFLCFYDKIAIGALNRLQERGYRVPEDVSLIAYGSEDSVSQMTKPELATISMSESEILLLALDALLEKIRHPEREPRDHEIAYRFCFRESLGAARPRVKGSENTEQYLTEKRDG